MVAMPTMAGQLICWLLVVGLQTALCQRVCEWKTCRECIRDPNVCMWCASEDFKGSSRCKPVTHEGKNWCPGKLQNPVSNITETDSKDFSSDFGHVIQIKPQRYHIDLRVGKEQEFSFYFKASDNFPVDIYFLMDASTSMSRMKGDLLSQTYNIFDTMKNLTTDVYMGLGTFIDKNLVPFNNKVINNQSYSFKHQLSLTSDIKQFENVLSNLTFGINSDAPESGFEGIAQAISCRKEVNWRKQSRKILVYMTDAAYHSAGDGRAAGIVKPYDGGCYLDANGFYTKEKEMDYPSVGIINYLAKREEIKIIFVSSFSNHEVYRELSKAVNESESIQFQLRHISNVLKEMYEKITKRVILTVNLTAVENKLVINFEPNCETDTANCKVTPGEVMNFTGKILLKQYFKKDSFTIGINPKGLKEKIVLDVNVISDCGCSNNEINSSRCNHIGNWSCGVCECPDAKFGPTCECTGNSFHCYPPNSTQICSDHGHCNACGKCDCADGYEGTYCEDQNNNCPVDDDDNLCSGHGNCLNGKCSCVSGWTGLACECTTSKEHCMKDGMECNSRGHCECGTCKCDTPAKWDVRIYESYKLCQPDCYDCHSRQCRHLIPCINCLHEGGSCTDKCGDTLIYLQDTAAEIDYSKWGNCSHVKVDFGCYSDYVYIYNDNDTMTLLVLNRNCSQSQIYIGVISVVVLVAIGLATLLAWKLLTNARDRREYEAFLKSSQGGDSIRINPTYTAPSTTYNNPAFQKTES